MDRSVAGIRQVSIPSLRAAGLLLAGVLAMLALPWAGTKVGDAVQPAFDWLDPDRAFVWISVHHVVQGGLALALIGLLVAFGWSRREFGFAWGDVPFGLKAAAVFAVVYGLLTIAWDFLPYALSGKQPGLAYFFTPTNVVGVLAFEWLLVGVSEEILFRGLILGLLSRAIRGTTRIGVGGIGFRISLAGLVTAVIFAFAHTIAYKGAFFLPFDFVPDWLQVLQAFILGVYYAALRERTGSLLGSILSHNISDGLYMSMIFLAVAVTS